jgi:hypothetical protein
MELDDFKQKTGNRPMPEINGSPSDQSNLNNFIEELKAKDAAQRKKVLVFIIVFFVFIAVYSSSMSLHLGGMRTGFSILVLGFLLILGYMSWRFLRLKNVDYTAPTATFLMEAEKRYKFMTPTDWIITIPLLMILITGGSVIVHSTFLRYFPDSYLPLVIYLCIMAGVVTVAFLAGFSDWKKKNGKVIERIRLMKKEFGI